MQFIQEVHLGNRVEKKKAGQIFLQSRAQLSLELLMVFLIFLSLLAISYAAASKAGDVAQRKIAQELSQSSFNGFASALDSACSLGNGNVRIVKIRGEKAAISRASDGASFAFTAGNFTQSANSSCEISILNDEKSDEFAIENKNGKIEIS